MKSLYVKKFALLFLLAASICIVAGCGSNGSTASSSESSGTGSIAAKLIWSSAGAKTTAKTLYLTPSGVTNVRITVSGTGISPAIFKNFSTAPGAAGSGTIDGIPAGIGREVKVEGLGTHGSQTGTFLTYLGTAIVNIVAGPNPPVIITMQAPVTTASPAATPSTVTLTTAVPATIYYTTNEPATIYYTTNGDTPTINSPNFGTSPVNVSIVPPVTLKYFAWVRGLYEAIITTTYSLGP